LYVAKQESKGRYEEALKYFNVAAQVQPDDVGAHINVGRTLNNLGQYEEAEKVYLVRFCNHLTITTMRKIVETFEVTILKIQQLISLA
jgi:tetratricopeptide (TPR) repeat protein